MFELRKQTSKVRLFRSNTSNEDGKHEAKLKRADSLYKQENFEEALKIYSALVDSPYNSAFLLYRKGACLDYLGDKLKFPS